MPTRFLVAALRFFGTTAVLGLALVALAPVRGVRLVGLVGLACAAMGFVLQLYALHRSDPQALRALLSRSEASVSRALRGSAVLHHHRPMSASAGWHRCGHLSPCGRNEAPHTATNPIFLEG